MQNIKLQFPIITVDLAEAVASCVRFEKSIFKASTDPYFWVKILKEQFNTEDWNMAQDTQNEAALL